ncbi:hypothetical protein D3C86_1706020 [compost metagenome]
MRRVRRNGQRRVAVLERLVQQDALERGGPAQTVKHLCVACGVGANGCEVPFGEIQLAQINGGRGPIGQDVLRLVGVQRQDLV